jgi:N-acetylglucosamine-6-phosphate deacetylase
MAQKCIGRDVASGAVVEIEFDSVINSVDHLLAPPADVPYVAPGWIDLQVNGFAGVDFNAPQASLQEIAGAIRAIFATGVTRFFPTIVTNSPEAMVGAVRTLMAARTSLPEGPAIEGFHMEGPYITPGDGARGAHPKRWVRPPDVEEYKRWQDAAQGLIKVVTLSPEWPQAPAYIQALVRDGVVAAIGHTHANSDQIEAAVDAGATLATHLGNGSDQVLPRHPNYIWDQLAEDRLAASFIADGIHLPPAFLKVAFRAKGIERSVLITDAVQPAGCPPGIYMLGEMEVELLPTGVVQLTDPGRQGLAGSALLMHVGVGNLMALAGLRLIEAVTMATRNPARVGRVAGRQRGLAAGERADLVVFRVDEATKKLTIEQTYMGGNLVYQGA